jgi:hypothetical protein
MKDLMIGASNRNTIYHHQLIEDPLAFDDLYNNKFAAKPILIEETKESHVTKLLRENYQPQDHQLEMSSNSSQSNHSEDSGNSGEFRRHLGLKKK